MGRAKTDEFSQKWVAEPNAFGTATPNPNDSSEPSRSYKQALIAGAVSACLPLLFFGSFGLFVANKMNDPFALVFFGGFAIVAALVFGGFTFGAILLMQTFGSFTGRQMGEAYRKFAHAVQGEFEEQTMPLLGIKFPKGVLFSHGAAPAVIDLETAGSGEDRETFTRLTLQLPQTADFNIRITPQGVLNKLGSLLGFQDVELGWPAFDDLCVVKSSNEPRLRAIFNRSLQEQYMKLLQFAGDCSQGSGGDRYLDFSLEGNRVQIRLRRFLETEEELAEYYARCGVFYDLLAEQLGKNR